MAYFFHRTAWASPLNTAALILAVCCCLAGCSGTPGPLTPPVDLETASAPDVTGGERMLWGYYLMHVNEDHSEITLEPLRSAQWHLNALSLIETFDPDAVWVEPDMHKWPDGTVTVAVGLRHPLPTYPKYTGFDIHGIMMLPSSYAFSNLGVSTPSPLVGDAALLNADGYTRRWNPTEFSARQHPFKYFDGRLIPPGLGALCDSLVNPYKDFYKDEERRSFGALDTVIAHYHISFPPGPIVFAYAVDASWDEPAVEDVYRTEFASDDPWKNQWNARNQDFGETSYWACDWFEGSVNVRDEECSYYGSTGETAILTSPRFDVPENTNRVSLYLTHSIKMDEDNGDDMCGVFITPSLSVVNVEQIVATNHPYDFHDPILGYDWWLNDYDSTEDVFDLSEALQSLDSEYFWFMFIFYTNDGDDIDSEGEGWTLDEMRLVDLNAQPTQIPDAFPMTANMIEPYNIELIDVSGMLECSLNLYAAGSVNLSVAVNDWQGGAQVPLKKARLEAPDLFDGSVKAFGRLSTAEGDLCFYEFTVPNTYATEPGLYPTLMAITVPDSDRSYVPGQDLTAYQMFTLEVEEVAPPFCYPETGIHNVYSGTYQIESSPGALHMDCSFMPIGAGGAGGLLFDGGILGEDELIQVAAISGGGGTVHANTLIQRKGPLAGRALVLQANEFNRHLAVVTDRDADNLLIYNAAGAFLTEYDLGTGEDGRNEPVCLTVNPANGDVWFVGHRGSDGVYLERWPYLKEGDSFEYFHDPLATTDLEPYLGEDPKPLGIAISAYYNRLYIFHAAYGGSIEAFDISQIPPVHEDQWSAGNIIGQLGLAIVTTSVDGLRRLIGGDILIDHADGEEEAMCRVLVFANTSDGTSWLVKLDSWSQTLASAPLGSPFACMALNNLPDIADRSLVFFPTIPTATYALFLAPPTW